MTSIVIGDIVGDGPFELDIQKHIISRGLALLGIRGGGKSYAAGKICEQLSRVKQPYLIIDLMGEYYTLKEHFPVVVISQGSEKYADVKNIKPEIAEAIAHVVLESGQSTALDLRAGTMLEKFKFLAKFLPGLYNAAKGLRKPLILVMDEAHRITPERSLVRLKELRNFQNTVIYWVQEIGATGRQYGLGFIVAARRSAEVAKSTLTQCELIINFKVRGIDLDKLGEEFEKANRDDSLKRIRMFQPGEAVVLGLEEPLFIKVRDRECPHGGGTPLAKPVEVPGMAKFSSMLKKALSQVQILPEKRVPEKVVAELETRRKQVANLEKTIAGLRGEIASLMADKEVAQAKIRGFEREVAKLREVPPERVAQLQLLVASKTEQVTEAQERIRDLEEQLSEASRFEEQLENIREGSRGLFDAVLDLANSVGVELIPQDITKLKQDHEDLRARLEVYENTEREKKIRIEETLKDPAIKNWIQDAESFLFRLKRSSRGVFPKVMKAALSMDPEVDFWPEEVEVGVTAGTVQGYLNDLVNKKLLWASQKRGRKAYRNRFSAWVGEAIRKIKPLAPDEAVKRIEEDLRRYVLKS